MSAYSTRGARNVSLEESNRAVVLKFYDDFINKHQTVEAAKVVVENYKQHNPDIPDGKAPFVDYFTGFFKENPQSRPVSFGAPPTANSCGCTSTRRTVRRTAVRPCSTSSV